MKTNKIQKTINSSCKSAPFIKYIILDKEQQTYQIRDSFEEILAVAQDTENEFGNVCDIEKCYTVFELGGEFEIKKSKVTLTRKKDQNSYEIYY